jgi:hypothetical protein
MSFWKWSRTAGTNATADGSINWAEGQAPSSVNDSARAMMAAAAKFRDDISGAITTGGTSSAYTVTSYQVFDSLAHLDGQMIAFIPHTTNTGAAGVQTTLTTDGLTAKPIRLAPNLEIPNGTLVQGTPYVVTYVNADGAYYLQGLGSGNPYTIPLGGLLPYIGTTAPNNSFVLPFGQAISRTTYATLFSLISTTRRWRWLDHVQRAGLPRASARGQGRHGRLGGQPYRLCLHGQRNDHRDHAWFDWRVVHPCSHLRRNAVPHPYGHRHRSGARPSRFDHDRRGHGCQRHIHQHRSLWQFHIGCAGPGHRRQYDRDHGRKFQHRQRQCSRAVAANDHRELSPARPVA